MPTDTRRRIKIDATHDLLAMPRDLRAAATIVRALASAGHRRRYDILRFACVIAGEGERAEEVLRANGL